MPCDCWTEEIWRLIHLLALICPLKETEEKAAFCTLIVSINKIISCTAVKNEVTFFMDQSDNNILQYLSSNERLVSWTFYLRQHINKLFSNPIPKLEELIASGKYPVKEIQNRGWVTQGYAIPRKLLEPILIQQDFFP